MRANLARILARGVNNMNKPKKQKQLPTNPAGETQQPGDTRNVPQGYNKRKNGTK